MPLASRWGKLWPSHDLRVNDGLIHRAHGGQAIHESHPDRKTGTNPASQPQASHHETYRRFSLARARVRPL